MSACVCMNARVMYVLRDVQVDGVVTVSDIWTAEGFTIVAICLALLHVVADSGAEA